MRLQVITRYRVVRDAVTHWARKGFVEVVSILCRDCGRWVDPGDWNPEFALCEVCTMHAQVEGRKPMRGNRWRTEVPRRSEIRGGGGVLACRG